jgi:23S rRNA pseudouridine2605 synthase
MNEEQNKTVRLQKYLADCGIGSRRGCEKLILDGKVTVDGEVVTELGVKVDPETANVMFDGQPVKVERKLWLMLNKPPHYICSAYDPDERPSFHELLPQNIGRIYNVGRLDYMSEGLLLVTNDGELANRLTHPRYEVHKTYEIRTVEKMTDDDLEEMRAGIRDEGEKLPVLSVERINVREGYPTYEIVLGEGRNRHIRRILAHLNIHLVSLKRTATGPLELGDLESGKWRELTQREVEALRKDCGI